MISTQHSAVRDRKNLHRRERRDAQRYAGRAKAKRKWVQRRRKRTFNFLFLLLLFLRISAHPCALCGEGFFCSLRECLMAECCVLPLSFIKARNRLPHLHPGLLYHSRFAFLTPLAGVNSDENVIEVVFPDCRSVCVCDLCGRPGAQDAAQNRRREARSLRYRERSE